MKLFYAVLLGSATVFGGEFTLSLPGDLDHAIHAKFYDGKVRAATLSRNEQWLGKGRFNAKDITMQKASFSGNTIDIFQNARGALIRYELDGKPEKVRAANFRLGVTRIRVANGQHTFRLLDENPRVVSVCLKEVVQQTAKLTSRRIKLPSGAKNPRAVFDGGTVKLIRDGKYVVLNAETTGTASGLKLLWDGGGQAEPVPRPQGTTAVKAWLVDNMTKILPAGKVPDHPAETFELTGAPGEVISFQVALSGSRNGEYVSVSGVSGCGKIKAAVQESVLVRATANRQGVKQAVAFLPAEIPDLLDTDSHEQFLKKGKISAFWLALDVPEGTAKGSYTGKLRVQTATGIKDLNLKIRICGFRMPTAAELAANTGDSTYRPGMYASVFGIRDGSPEYFKMFDQSLGIIKRSRQNVVEFSWDYSLFSMIPGKKGKDGKWEFDFTKFDRYHGRLLNAFRDYPGFQMVIPFDIAIRSPNWKFTPSPGMSAISFWQDYDKGIITPGAVEYYHAFLPALFNHLDKYNARHKIYFRIGDEASRDLLTRYRSGLKLIREAAPDAHIQDAVNHSDSFRILCGLIDRPIPNCYILHELVKDIEQRTKKGKICGMYMASSGPIGAWMDMKLAAIRLEPFLAYRYGITYIAHFGWNECFNIDMREYPSKNIGAFTTPGDYGKVYLIPERKKILPSLRLAAMRDSRQDFALLYLLEKLNREAMKKLGVKGDPAVESRELCRMLRDVPDMFQADSSQIAKVRSLLYTMIEERSGKIPAVITADMKENSSAVDITVKTLPGQPIRINGKDAPSGKAKVFLSPTKNLVVVEVGGQKFTRCFQVDNDKSKYLESLLHKLRQFSRKIPADLLQFSEKFRLASEHDFDELAAKLPEMEKQAESLYIDEHLRCFLNKTGSPELQGVVKQIGQLKAQGKPAAAIRLIDMVMLVEPPKLREKPPRVLIYPTEKDGNFFWNLRNAKVHAVFQADTMRLVSLKRGGREFMGKGMVEMFSFDSLSDNPKDWKTSIGEDSEGKVVLLARRQFNDENILRRVILTANSDRIYFRTRIQAENLPTWNFKWRTHAWYRGTTVGGVKISDIKHFSKHYSPKPLEIADDAAETVLRVIPVNGIQKITFWHEYERHTLDLFAQNQYQNAIGQVIEIGYDLLPGKKGEKLHDVSGFPGEKTTFIDLRKKPELPFRIHGEVEFTSKGLKLDGNGCIEFKPNPAFEWQLPFRVKIDFTTSRGGVLFKRSCRQGELYISMQPKNYIWALIAPSRITSETKYISLKTEAPPPGRHEFEMRCDGERVQLLMDGKVRKEIFRPGPFDSIGGRNGLFLGAYGVEGKKPRLFFKGIIHSVTITQGIPDPALRGK